MSHEITQRANGAYEMASRAKEWHYGETAHQIILPGDDIETIQAKAGMDWRIQRSKVRFATDRDSAGLEQFATMEDQHVLLRSDTKAPLSIVSSKFQVVQPRQTLEFFRDLTEKAGFQIETAGTLFGGRKFWTLASIGEGCEIVPGDKVGGYLLLATACDGTMATTGKFVAERVVCNNTITIALAEGGQQHKISHRTSFDPAAMKAALGLAHESFDLYADNMRRLADKAVSAARAERLTFELLAPAGFDNLSADDKVKTIDKVSGSAGFRSIMALFDGAGLGAQMDGVKGTAWGWLNACTEHFDHHARATSDDNRTNAAWFGLADAAKSRAAELAATF